MLLSHPVVLLLSLHDASQSFMTFNCQHDSMTEFEFSMFLLVFCFFFFFPDFIKNKWDVLPFPPMPHLVLESGT